MAKNQIPAIREATGAFCRSILDAILPAVREAARFQGYAITVHGSLQRDIDLVAVPWTDQAAPPDELLRVVKGAIGGILGNCLQIGGHSQKPHGRIAYTLAHPGFAGEIDLSIMPLRLPTGAKSLPPMRDRVEIRAADVGITLESDQEIIDAIKDEVARRAPPGAMD